MLSKTEWKKKAEACYLDGLGISETAALLGVSRQSISAHLKGCESCRAEKERRKQENAARRRAYKTEKQRQYRAAGGMTAVTADTMRREHDLAALELSREIYH